MPKTITNLSFSKLIERYPHLEVCSDSIVQATQILVDSFSANGKLMTMGNGGSSADAEHICGELMKGFASGRKLSMKEAALFQNIDPTLAANLQGSLPAISLSVNHALMSAFANDMNPQYCFAQQVWGLANQQDVVMGISTSGNSMNVVHALNVAKAKGVRTIGLTGSRKSKISEIVDVCIHAPATMTHHIQELHLPIYHAICLEIENHFFL